MLMLKLLGDVLAAPIKGPVNGFEFILNSLREQVESEALDESKLQGELMQLGMRYQAGEMDDAEYAAKEDAILEQMNEIRRYKQSLEQEEADLAGDALQEEPGSAESAVADGGEMGGYPAASENAST